MRGGGDGPYQATGTPKSLDRKFITEMARNMTSNDFADDARTLERWGWPVWTGTKFDVWWR
jgi:hypothetical protein